MTEGPLVFVLGSAGIAASTKRLAKVVLIRSIAAPSPLVRRTRPEEWGPTRTVMRSRAHVNCQKYLGHVKVFENAHDSADAAHSVEVAR